MDAIKRYFDNLDNLEPAHVVLSGTIPANQRQDLVLTLPTDADFGIIAKYGNSTGAFSARLMTSTGRFIEDADIPSDMWMGSTPANALPIEPGIPYPGGTQLRVQVLNLTGASNTITIYFVGVKELR